MKIVKATLSDVIILSQIVSETFLKTYTEINPENTDLLTAYVLETFNEMKITSELNRAEVCFYLLKENDQVLGYAKTVKAVDKLEVEKLYLVSGNQGRGLGSKLFNHILDHARSDGIKTLWLNVYDQNPGAIKFYQCLGFVKVGERDFKYHWNGQDYRDNDWVMELAII